MTNYVPYHLHSDYSLLDSCTNYKDYIDLACSYNMPAIAFTEHGKLSGWVKKKQYCDEKGIWTASFGVMAHLRNDMLQILPGLPV